MHVGLADVLERLHELGHKVLVRGQVLEPQRVVDLAPGNDHSDACACVYDVWEIRRY